MIVSRHLFVSAPLASYCSYSTSSVDLFNVLTTSRLVYSTEIMERAGELDPDRLQAGFEPASPM